MNKMLKAFLFMILPILSAQASFAAGSMAFEFRDGQTGAVKATIDNSSNTVVYGTMTVAGQDGEGYSLTVSSGIRAHCITLNGGTLCGPTAQSTIILASPSNGNFILGVSNDGVLTTTPTTDPAGSDVFLTAPNAAIYKLGVDNDGTLTTAPNN